MKKSLLRKGIFFFLFCTVFGPAVSRGVSAWTADEVKGFGKTVFDYHFSRADRELSPEGWLAEARRGVGLALSAWERIAEKLYLDPLFMEETGAELRRWSEDELEARFTRWLFRRFFGENAEDAVEGLSQITDASHLRYTYHLDAEGELLREEETGDPRIIRPGETDFSGDHEYWKRAAEEGLLDGETRYGTILSVSFPELLAWIAPERRDEFEEKLRGAGNMAGISLRGEFENLVAREERLFIARRTGDVYSLRKKSDDEAASMITSRLIGEAETICAGGIASLTARIEDAAAGTGDLALAGSEWLEEYREQFNRGLEAWEEAEERFFMRRIEWEQDAGLRYAEGEESWVRAFERFEEERRNWELNVKALFESGEKLFLDASENLERAIIEAKAEFETDARLRAETGAVEAGAWVDMYLAAGSMAGEAGKNIRYWLQFYGSAGAPDISDSRFEAWIEDELGKPKNSKGEYRAMLEEIKKWFQLYRTYTARTVEARETLAGKFGLVMGEGGLTDILAEGADSSGFFLDEYQIELVRIKALAGYWAKRLAIAEAVSAYAADLTAGRMTDAEGLMAWEASKRACDEALENCGAALARLNQAGADLAEAQTALNEAAAALKEADEKLVELDNEYSSMMTVYVSEKNDFILEELDSKYKKLFEEYTILNHSGADAAYFRYLKSSIALADARRRDLAGEKLKALIQGIDGEASLGAVREAAERAKVFNEEDDLPETMEGYGLAGDNPYYGLIESLLPGKALYHDLIVSLCGAAKSSLQAELELRLQAISLFSAGSSAEWYRGTGLHIPAEEDIAGLTPEDLMGRLLEAAGASYQTLLEARIDLETAGLEAFLNGAGLEDPEGLLAALCLTDRAGAESALILLKDLKDRIRGGGQIASAEEEWFVSGGSFFMAAEGYLRPELDDFRWKSGLLELYRIYGNGIDYAEGETWNHTLRKLDSFFTVHGIETEGALFPGTESVKDAILAKGGDPLFHTAEFIGDLDRQFYLLPSWLAGVLDEWKNAFAAYMYTLTEGTDGGEGETHWREYLGRYPGKDGAAAAEIPPASTRAEGDILDAKDSADRQLNMLRDAMALYGEYTASVHDGWASLVRACLDDPAASWDEGILCPADPLLEDSSNAEEMEYRIRLLNEKMLQSEIVRLGKIYELSGKTARVIGETMDRQLEKIEKQKEAVEAAKRGYELAADRFYENGTEYDNRYVLLKKAQDHQEEMRFEYEKQDAIRRWASTAYLGGDSDEEALCRSNLERAETALRTLESLYGGGEERRPYADEEYARLYREYGESTGRMVSVIGALDLLDKAILEAEETGSRLYETFMQSLSLMQGNIEYDEHYTSPDNRGDWNIKDIIGVNDKGMLCFSFGGINENSLKILKDYLERTGTDEQGRYELSRFDEAVLALNQRMALYLTGGEKYEQWGLARDFLIKCLSEANGDISYLKENYRTADQLKPGTPLGELDYYKGLLGDIEIWEADRDAVNYVSVLQYFAYINMSDAERADLEFFTILNLFGGGGRDGSPFTIVSVMREYGYVTEAVRRKYTEFARKCDDWWEPKFLYRGHRDRAKNVYLRMLPMYFESFSRFVSGSLNLADGISRLNTNNRNYLDSCAGLAALTGENGEKAVEWDDIERSLKTAGVSDEKIIGDIRTCWNMMADGGNAFFYSVTEAMAGLAEWSTGVRDEKKQALEKEWEKDELVRTQYLSGFRAITDAFIAGKADLRELSECMEDAFGSKAPSLKNHLENMEEILGTGLSGMVQEGNGGRQAGAVMAKEYAALVTRAVYQRSQAELAAREEEWNIERNDIVEKYLVWKNTAARILEKGREDWNNGTARIRKAFNQWDAQFNEEYKMMDEAWNAAFLAALEDKEAWLDRAAETAAAASSGAMLALVGAGAEAGARAMDTRIPVGMTPAFRADEAEALLEELLGASGIRNMADAFHRIGGIAETTGTFVRRGIGGPGFWNAGAAKVAAANLIRESNAELAARESRRLAIVARTAAREAAASLESVVNDENKNFRASLDEMLIFDGQWRRNGNNYIKDIVVHSTLFDPVITEQREITGYRNYRFQMPEFKTSLDEDFLEKLDAFAIQALIQNIYREVGDIQRDVFGAEDEKKTEVKIYNETRFIEPGKFGLHIGYMPVQHPSPDIDGGKSGVILHPGAGELGRIISDYYYWAVIDAEGIARSSMAPWDRPLWDSRGSWFEAPTTRSISEIALQTITGAATLAVSIVVPLAAKASVAATIGVISAVAAVETAINLVDDAIFFTLDTGFSYKRFDEAGFEFGKKALITASSSIIGAVLGGVGNLPGLTGILTENIGFLPGRITAKTLMTGTQAAISGVVTNALSGIQYSHEGGWSYSNKTFTGGLAGVGINMLSAMTATLTGEVMNWGLEGFYGDVYSNGTRLSALTGGLAGQGVNYAFGNGFALNLANSGLLTHWLLSNAGYLETDPGLLSHESGTGFMELRLGNEGAQMGFGTGGLDVSIGTLAAASKGFEAWRENARLLLANDVTRKHASQMRTLYSGDEKNRKEYESYIAGTTVAKERRGIVETESFFDETTGVKYVYFGEKALNDESRFGLNIYFAHESYRNGRDDGELGQIIETYSAVTGHIAAALGIMGTYGENSIGFGLAQEARDFYNNITLAMSTGNSEAANDARIRIGAILGNYDSGGDFWKLLNDGTLMNDNKGWLTDTNNNPVRNNRGDQIGADGIETGLLNILFGGTHGVIYDEYTESQISLAQSLMIAAGMNYREGADGKIQSRSWSGNKKGQKLDMLNIMNRAGNSIAAQVFARYYDATADALISKNLGKGLDIPVTHYVPYVVKDRFANLLDAKTNFYGSLKSFLDLSRGYSVTGEFGDEYIDKNGVKRYASYDYKHYGEDFARGEEGIGDPIFAGMSGRVTDVNWNENNGNCLQMEYGYFFEGNVIGTGIYGEYLHMNENPYYSINNVITSGAQLGRLGDTGVGSGPHLHYDILTKGESYYSASTLTMLLGNTYSDPENHIVSNPIFWDFKKQASRTAYKPSLYYRHSLGTTLTRK
ncbi:MAG: M23 family metallopeptidase [Treponema sp.]|jgi:murein DD-endopeptidase MepM/ murein hydrolase activator NlpD|nr:M23 family metallopeptidase [Treponema sp.]